MQCNLPVCTATHAIIACTIRSANNNSELRYACRWNRCHHFSTILCNSSCLCISTDHKAYSSITVTTIINSQGNKTNYHLMTMRLQLSWSEIAWAHVYSTERFLQIFCLQDVVWTTLLSPVYHTDWLGHYGYHPQSRIPRLQIGMSICFSVQVK